MVDTTSMASLFDSMCRQVADNLKLLSTPEFIRRHKETTVEINDNTFKKLTPKSFQLITYHLFQTLNPEECRKRFMGCFPVFDRKQEGEFRQVTYKWLQEIALKETDYHFPKVVAVYFQHFTPETTLCHLYLDFSNYCIAKQIQRMNSEESDINNKFIPKKDFAVNDVNQLMDEYYAVREDIRVDTADCMEKMRYFVDNYNKTKQELNYLQQQKTELIDSISKRYELNDNQIVDQFCSQQLLQYKHEVDSLTTRLLSMNELFNKNWENYVKAFEVKTDIFGQKMLSINLNQLFTKSSFETTANELICIANNDKSCLVNVSNENLDEFLRLSDKFRRKADNYSQQLNGSTNQIKSMFDQLNGLTVKRRAALLAKPEIQERRNWFRSRIVDLSQLNLRFEPKRRPKESLGLIPDIIGDNMSEDQKNAAVSQVDDSSSSSSSSPVYRLRPSFINDYSFQVLDISTCRYIPPSSGCSPANDLLMFSPVDNRKTKSGVFSDQN
ncbi:uncharacterized protein LOC128966034 [Oppia nitens]|uniref:uncharacterized protein LOC128966034 n=1 Tax=Oppia nitens TaxID=1686743 RepID=UPI0023DB9CA1|nr:uncharacterized protein LOC128966034 [Oppia nitens]